MATGKTTTLTFRIEPALKEGLRAASIQEPRSIANMVAVMIRDYCGRNGITIQEQVLAFGNDRTTKSPKK